MVRQTDMTGGRTRWLRTAQAHTRQRHDALARHDQPGLCQPGQQLYLPAARTNILRMAEKRKTDPIAHDAFLLETEQTQPVADAPGGVKSCWTHESAVTAARHPLRQRPQGQRIEAEHHETTTVTEDALAFPQQTMRL